MNEIICGDCLDILDTLPAESVHTCVTSPPYYGLRDYGVDDQLGLEPTPEEYVENMVQVFRKVRRVLRDDGTLWLNLGDSYAGSSMNGGNGTSSTLAGTPHARIKGNDMRFDGKRNTPRLKPKDLIGIPWRVALALQADGWWLRSDIIWHKTNPMPESVTDRPTKSHEYIFLLSKSARYFYDAEAVKEPIACPERYKYGHADQYHDGNSDPKGGGFRGVGGASSHYNGTGRIPSGRNKRTVWTVSTRPFRGAHFATFPPKLIEPCVKAGTSERGCCPQCGAPWERVVEKGNFIKHENGLGNGTQTKDLEIHQRGESSSFKTGGQFEKITIGWRPTCECGEGSYAPIYGPDSIGEMYPPEPLEPVPCTVLDPFGGAGTTGLVAHRLRRRYVLIELNPEYCDMARERLRVVQPVML